MKTGRPNIACQSLRTELKTIAQTMACLDLRFTEGQPFYEEQTDRLDAEITRAQDLFMHRPESCNMDRRSDDMVLECGRCLFRVELI